MKNRDTYRDTEDGGCFSAERYHSFFWLGVVDSPRAAPRPALDRRASLGWLFVFRAWRFRVLHAVFLRTSDVLPLVVERIGAT